MWVISAESQKVEGHLNVNVLGSGTVVCTTVENHETDKTTLAFNKADASLSS